MTEKNDFDEYFNHQKSSSDNVFREIPTNASNIYPDRVPNGYDPMGEIELRGRAASSFTSGRMPWWIIVTSWILFAPIALLLIYIAIDAIEKGGFLQAIFPSTIALIILSILWRGTKGKFDGNKRTRRHKRTR